jgi:hypothetical protein
VAQGVGPEFKPQHQKKKKKIAVEVHVALSRENPVSSKAVSPRTMGLKTWLAFSFFFPPFFSFPFRKEMSGCLAK